MARYIDADALLAEAMADGAYGYVDAKQIAEAPAADVAPVRHGRWIKQSDRTKPLYGWNICSECGVVLGSVAPYCSECGAKMDGGEQ